MSKSMCLLCSCICECACVPCSWLMNGSKQTRMLVGGVLWWLCSSIPRPPLHSIRVPANQIVAPGYNKRSRLFLCHGKAATEMEIDHSCYSRTVCMSTEQKLPPNSPHLFSSIDSTSKIVVNGLWRPLNTRWNMSRSISRRFSTRKDMFCTSCKRIKRLTALWWISRKHFFR